MPSLRSRLIRLTLKYVVGPKFRRAGRSVSALRDLDRMILRHQRVPAGTKVRSVSAGGVDADWVLGPGAREDGVALYLHGGGFLMGSPATHRELAARISSATGLAALVPDYRLAPEHPFPAAVQDATSAYRWLLGEGFADERVAIGGDSAGGGLALQTLLGLRDEGLPRPAVGFALSPVADWVHHDGDSLSTRAGVDPMVTREMCEFSASLYVGDHDRNAPLLSPVRADLSGLPPLCVHVGDHEVLLSDSVRLAERARACGVEIELKVWPGMWHVFQASASIVPEARASIEEIGRFVANRIRRPVARTP